MSAYRVLVRANHFAGPAVGIAGVTPDEITAFRQLARHPRATSIFKHLLLRASLAGKLYALAGLRRTRPTFFPIAAAPFRAWPGSVDTFFGCIIQAEPVTKIVSDPDNAVRLKRNETLETWWQQHPSERAGRTCDIAGGGYSSMFLDPPPVRRPAV